MSFPPVIPSNPTVSAVKTHGVNLGKPYLYSDECPWTNRAKQGTLWHEFDITTGKRVDTYVVANVTGVFEVGEEINNFDDPVVSVPGNEWMQRAGTIRAIPNGTTLVLDADLGVNGDRSLRAGSADIYTGQNSGATCTVTSTRGVVGALNAQGYPTALLAGTYARSFMANSASQVPTGTWVCAWDGGGTVRFDTAAGGTTNASGRIERSVTYAGSFTVEIQSLPVTNLRVYYKPYEQYLLGTGCDPDFVIRWFTAGINSVRFMDYQDTNGSIVETAADIKPDDYHTESNLTGEISEDAYQRRGCSIGAITKIAVALGLARIAVCVPHRVWRDPTDSWLLTVIPRLLGEFQGEIDLEVSNEVWNTFGAISIQTNDLQDAGVNGVPAIGYAARTVGSNTDKMNQAFGAACEKVFRRAHDIAGSQAARIKRVIGMWATNWSYHYNFRTRIGQNSDVSFVFDKVAPSGYVSNNLGIDHSSATVAAWTPAQWRAYALTDLNNRVYGAGGNEELAVRAAADNATITFYETGNHDEFGGMSGPARTAMEAWFDSDECRQFIANELCPKLRNTTNSEGHGYWYNSVGRVWGLIPAITGFFGQLPTAARYVGYAQAGATLTGGGGGGTNFPPVVQSPATQNLTVGDTGTLQLVGSDPESQPLIWSFPQGKPAWLDLDANTGVVSWNSIPPAAASRTPYTVVFRATDPPGAFAEGALTINVQPMGGWGGSDSPVIVPPPTITATEGQLSTFQFTLQAGTPPITWTGSNLPPGCAITTSGLLIAQPTPGVVGTFQCQVTATNAHGADNKPFTLIINPSGNVTSIIINVTGASRVSIAPVLKESYARS